MENKISKILVPIDFTPASESAAAHAAIVARKTGDEICLLHVITKETKAELKKQNLGIESLLEKIKSLSETYQQQYKATYSYSLKEGSIFTTIGEVIEEMDAKLVVLGTHGVHGVQRIVGAYALKVVATSKVPVIVVQEKKPEKDNYLKIVSPIDITSETKQKTQQTITMAKALGAKVYLYKQKGYDDSLNNVIKLNLNFVLRYLNEHNIESEVVEQEKATSDFAADFTAYAKKIEADLIIILTSADMGVKEFFLGPDEQAVINNKAQIPVMCVNPLQNIYSTERLSSMVNLSF